MRVKVVTVTRWCKQDDVDQKDSEQQSSIYHRQTLNIHPGVCEYYIGPIGDLSLLTATAATSAAARIHSLHSVIKIKFQKWRCCVLL